MKKLLILALFASHTLFAQEFTKTLDDFAHISLSKGIDATLVKSNSKVLKVKTFGLDEDDVIIENDHNELSIRVATKGLWNELDDNHWWVRVEIPFQELKSIELNMGSRVISRDIIKTDDLGIDVGTGSEVELKIEVTELMLDVTTGSEVDIEGKADFLDVKAYMGSEVDLGSLTTRSVRAKSTMGSDLKVYASEKFDGQASMGGMIKVYGDPVKFYESTNMGGDIWSNR
ncbi:MAG: DUF2807 domain-containing protein [Bacteroidota bacterium]